MRRTACMVLMAAAVLLVPTVAEACPVCFGAVDGPAARGVNNGILVMLAVVGMVQVGFVVMFVGMYRRNQRREADEVEAQETNSEVINGGGR